MNNHKLAAASEELKACPFCGSEMKLETIADVTTGPGEVFVQCRCGATGGGGGNLDEAIVAWNNRAAQPAEQASAGSIGDDAEFKWLVEFWAGKHHSTLAPIRDGHQQAWTALVAYIDSRPRQADQQAPSDTQGAGELPELPKAFDMLIPQRTPVYHAGQMRAYALAALAKQATDTVRDAPFARDDVLAEVATWYKATGCMLDKCEVPTAIRYLKSTAPKLAGGEGA